MYKKSPVEKVSKNWKPIFEDYAYTSILRDAKQLLQNGKQTLMEGKL